MDEKKKKEKQEEKETKGSDGIHRTEETEEKNDKKKEEVEKLKKRIEELETQTKRTLADYQNLEKRTREQQREMVLAANRELLLKILPLLDTLFLAKKHEENETLTIVIKQFLDTLKAEGVEKIETVGKPFDPYTMEAIETVEGEKNIVAEETMSGYKLYDKVLRPARVKVGK